MIANSKTVMATVRDALRTKFLRVAVACLIPFITGMILVVTFSMLFEALPKIIVAILAAAAVFFILYPIIMGTVRFFVRFIKGGIEEDAAAVFYYFTSGRKYGKILYLQIILLIKKLGVGLVTALPMLIAWVISGSFVYDLFNIAMPIWAQSVSYIIIYLRVLGFVAYFLITLRYYLAPFLLAADEGMHAAEAVYMSKLISKRTLIDFVFLLFSHIIYILLSFILLPAVFTLPYLVGAYVVHCDSAVEQYNNTVKKLSEEDTLYIEEV